MSEDYLDEKSLSSLSSTVVKLLESWALDTKDMQNLLCLPESYRARKFNKLREGNEVLPNDQVVLSRASLLLRISEALRTTYPLNPEMAGRWIRMSHRRFRNRTPLNMILEQGEVGLIAVLSDLDCTFSWDMTGSVAPKGRC